MTWTLYAWIGVISGACFGIPRVWKSLDDGKTEFDAMFDGGTLAALAAMTWPFFLFGLSVGLIAREARKQWLESTGDKK